MGRRSSARVLAFVALILTSGRLRAEDVTAVRLSYSASRDCPDEHGFFEQVTARTQRVRLAKPDEPATALVVKIRDVPGGVAGKFELRSDEGTTSAREVKAASCDQAVAALAIMAALAIDPDASTEPLPKPTPPPRPAPKPVAPPKPKPTAPAPASSLRTHFEAGVSLALLDHIFSDSALAVRPFLALTREGRPAFGYTLRLSAARFQSKVSRSEGTGEFALYVGRIEGCPAHVRAWEALWFSGCVGLDAGWLDARGADVTPSESVTRFWLAAATPARLELRMLEILSFELSGELLFPFVRDRFFVGSDQTVHRTPAVGFGGAVGLGVFFP